MENIKTSLERWGASLDDVVKCTVFMADIDEWSAMNEVYVTYFQKHKPARSALAAAGLALNSRVEIECMAVTQ
jgi:enamine deaminase RidA (YjgF/YER057c/UK114 family)